MALLNVGDVVQSVATLMDDPSQSAFDKDYVIPFLNLRWANLIVNLAMLGLQYSEEMAVVTVPAGTVSLTNMMLSGGVLASLMSPIGIDWKLVGSDDSTYAHSNAVTELEDLAQGTVGLLQYSWQGGTILTTPSAQDVVMRIRFNAMSTTLVDPTDNMIRGVGDIISFRTAELIYGIRGNAVQKVDMKNFGDDALNDFIALSIMTSQAIRTSIPSTHRRNGNGGNRFVAR
jgi:hypothetical protein